MPKGLRLKKTPTEQVEHDMRRARRAAKKAAHRQYRAHDGDFDSDGRSSKRSRTVGDDGVNLDPSFSGPEPSPLRDGAHTVVEEEIFQEKLWNALGEDERLDGIEARLNEDVYVPRRWRGISSQASSSDTVGGPGDNPNIMNDDEYAEWVRAGMRRCVLPNVRANRENSQKHLTENAMPRHIASRSGKGCFALGRKLKSRVFSRRMRMPVGARDMSGNEGGMQMPLMHTSSAGWGSSNQNRNLQIWGSEIYRGRCRTSRQIFPRLRPKPFPLSFFSLRKDLTRPREGGRARRNLEGRCCDFTQINLKGGSYHRLNTRKGQPYERVRMP
jgi:hypothetical protein